MLKKLIGSCCINTANICNKLLKAKKNLLNFGKNAENLVNGKTNRLLIGLHFCTFFCIIKKTRYICTRIRKRNVRSFVIMARSSRG
jgi:hypothetical protein